eukprot:1862509-Rhodomonas_salina.1
MPAFPGCLAVELADMALASRTRRARGGAAMVEGRRSGARLSRAHAHANPTRGADVADVARRVSGCGAFAAGLAGCAEVRGREQRGSSATAAVAVRGAGARATEERLLRREGCGVGWTRDEGRSRVGGLGVRS